MKQIIIKCILFVLVFYLHLLGQNKINFEAETLDGKEIQIADVYKNGPTLISFWALWCKPCRSEMKRLERLYQKYKNQNMTIIGVNQDSPKSLAKVKAYITSHSISYPIVTDLNKEIFEQFNGQSIPLSILIDTSGRIKYTHIGYLPGDEKRIEEEIKKLLTSAKQ